MTSYKVKIFVMAILTVELTEVLDWNKNESITIHFGGAPKADNFLPIVPGWNYIVRLYKPKKEILYGN